MPSKPTGTVTFLFTDIENSTQLAREHPESWDETQARHHAILHEAIESNNGFVFQIIGDAFCAAFDKVGNALGAAIKAQQDLQNELRGEVTIYVRMGIHTGEAELVGNEYRGYTTLSFVQRLTSAGHGGQILVSNTTENLLREGLSGQINLRDMGLQKFAGVPSPVRIFQAIAPHLPMEFPPLRTLDNLLNNLPTQLTSFVGREKELADVKRLLHNTRMLTLLGPGGTGKTRLSIQAASEMLDQYPDGVWFVELASILDPLLVPQTTAVAIGLRLEPQRPAIDMLCHYLHEKKILIVLDNCEHLVDACARMADRILHAALHTRILASSREALGIGGEVTYRVPSLELPDPSKLPTVESLSQYEAVKLFIDRAMSAVPTFTVTNSNAPAVAQVCYQLDGIPLAIELAAAKIRVLSVEQIAKRLDNRFRLLTGSSRSVLERHQTLRAAIDWSYNLLSDAEQVLFQKLSIFIGGWTLEAAEFVCEGGGVKSDDVLNLLEQLVNKSLVIAAEVRQEARYHMLETLRQYAREKLFESEGSEDIRDMHLSYFVKLAAQAEPELYRSHQVFWMNKLGDDLDNLRGALEWALTADAESGLRLIVASQSFWGARGELHELGGWLAQLLERYTEFDSLRARALVIYGEAVGQGKDLIEAKKIAEQSLQISRATADKSTEAESLGSLGIITAFLGDQRVGVSMIEQSLAIYRSLGNKLGQANCIAWLTVNNDDLERSKVYLVESLRLYRELGHLSGIARTLADLANTAIWQEDFSAALPWLEEAAMLYETLGNQGGQAWIWGLSGRLAYWQGDYEKARACAEEYAKLNEKVGDILDAAWARVSIAYVFLRQGDYERAKEMFSLSIGEFQKVNSSIGVVFAIEGVASLHVNQGRSERAGRLFVWADAMREKIGDHRPPVEQASVERDLAAIRDKLDAAEFARFSEVSQAMTLEDAIALALEPTE